MESLWVFALCLVALGMICAGASVITSMGKSITAMQGSQEERWQQEAAAAAAKEADERNKAAGGV